MTFERSQFNADSRTNERANKLSAAKHNVQLITILSKTITFQESKMVQIVDLIIINVRIELSTLCQIRQMKKTPNIFISKSTLLKDFENVFSVLSPNIIT